MQRQANRELRDTIQTHSSSSSLCFLCLHPMVVGHIVESLAELYGRDSTLHAKVTGEVSYCYVISTLLCKTLFLCLFGAFVLPSLRRVNIFCFCLSQVLLFVFCLIYIFCKINSSTKNKTICPRLMYLTCHRNCKQGCMELKEDSSKTCQCAVLEDML